MKRTLIALVIMMGLSIASHAQTSMKMKDGVMMKNNIAMLCQGKNCKPLTKTYTCSDGCKISKDGTITKPDGTTMKLMEGNLIGKDGKMMMIAHGEAGHVCNKDCPMAKKM